MKAPRCFKATVWYRPKVFYFVILIVSLRFPINFRMKSRLPNVLGRGCGHLVSPLSVPVYSELSLSRPPSVFGSQTLPFPFPGPPFSLFALIRLLPPRMSVSPVSPCNYCTPPSFPRLPTEPKKLREPLYFHEAPPSAGIREALDGWMNE